MATYLFIVATACTFEFMGPGFLNFFKTFALGVSISLVLGEC